MVLLDKALLASFSTDAKGFNALISIKGHVYRQLENRCTQRIVIHNKPYFIKTHLGIGWREIFKNVFQWKWPVFGAKNEVLAIEKLNALNIPTLTIVGYGWRGFNPASQHSFVMTEELPDHVSLEEHCSTWPTQAPPFRSKLALISQVAHIAHVIHTNGVNHRDFYLCHFLLQKNVSPFPFLFLVDLHRAQIRATTPSRWLIKDLSGLYFSSKNIGLTSRDRLRFIKKYRNKSLRDILTIEHVFWHKVMTSGEKLYNKQAR